MTPTADVTDRNGMNHDNKGQFSKSNGAGAHGHGGGGARKRDDRARSGERSRGGGYDDLLASLAKIKSGLGGTYPGAQGGASGGGYGASSHGGYGGYGGHYQSYQPPKPKPAFRIPNVKTEAPPKQVWRYTDSKGKVADTRIDRITDRPVSQEMEDAINRLQTGEEIPMSEIEAIPEIRNEKRLADAYCTLDEFMHPEDYRNKDWTLNEIYREFSSPTVTQKTNPGLSEGQSYEVKQGKELWLVTGLPGSGKSTNFVGPISEKNGARIVDSDAIKERMPGYCKGLGAPNVHLQSKNINDRILAESLKRGDNIVYPVLGYNADYVGNQIDTFRRKGYKVHLVLNELPFSQSLARCLERRLQTGRNIPIDMFKKVGDRPSEAYETLKKKVDTFEKYSGCGFDPELVEKGANKDLPPPKPEERPVYAYHGKPIHGVETYEHDNYGNLSFSGGDNRHVAEFAKEFKVKPQAKPKYWAKSWLDSFTHGGKKGAHDAQDGGREAAEAARFGAPPFRRVDIPEAFDGEIDGYETARDLARFHYIACDCEDEY